MRLPPTRDAATRRRHRRALRLATAARRFEASAAPVMARDCAKQARALRLLAARLAALPATPERIAP